MAALKIVSVLFFTVCMFKLASTTKIDLAKVDEKCENEIGISPETIIKFNLTRPIETDDQKIKCYLKCLFQETEWMTPDGELKEGMYDNDEVRAEYKPLVDQCMSFKEENACETAFLFHKCVTDKKEGN